MTKNIFFNAKLPHGRTPILGRAHIPTMRLAADAGLISAALTSAIAGWSEQLVSSHLGTIQVAEKIQNGPDLVDRAETAVSAEPMTALTAMQAVEPQSTLRRHYESFGDRDQLARAIFVNGDWGDPEIADLVRKAASSPTIEGQLLCALIDDGEKFNASNPEPAPNPARALVGIEPRQQPVPPTAAAGRTANPFGTQGVHTVVKSCNPTETGPVEGVYDPFSKTCMASSQNRSAPNANPFLLANCP